MNDIVSIRKIRPCWLEPTADGRLDVAAFPSEDGPGGAEVDDFVRGDNCPSVAVKSGRLSQPRIPCGSQPARTFFWARASCCGKSNGISPVDQAWGEGWCSLLAHGPHRRRTSLRRSAASQNRRTAAR